MCQVVYAMSLLLFSLCFWLWAVFNLLCAIGMNQALWKQNKIIWRLEPIRIRGSRVFRIICFQDGWIFTRTFSGRLIMQAGTIELTVVLIIAVNGRIFGENRSLASFSCWSGIDYRLSHFPFRAFRSERTRPRKKKNIYKAKVPFYVLRLKPANGHYSAQIFWRFSDKPTKQNFEVVAPHITATCALECHGHILKMDRIKLPSVWRKRFLPRWQPGTKIDRHNLLEWLSIFF